MLYPLRQHDSAQPGEPGREQGVPRPARVDVRQVRLARPTQRLDEVTAFYVDGLRLPRLGGFVDHDGFDGVFVGLPGAPCHLELTRHAQVSAVGAPSSEHLLVLYLGTTGAVQAVVDRLAGHGHRPVAADNPYWARIGAVTVPDPDGWRVVLVPGDGFGS